MTTNELLVRNGIHVTYRRILVLASMYLFCSGASAELTIEKYREGRSSSSRDIRGMVVAYISGVGAAYSFANSELEREHQPPLFCQPRTLALSADLLLRLLDQELQSSAYRPEFTVEIAVLFALKRSYPCR
jgi:hypothetical protein